MYLSMIFLNKKEIAVIGRSKSHTQTRIFYFVKKKMEKKENTFY